MSPLVLIVEDDVDSRTMLHAALSGEGFAPASAVDGDSALALLAELVPDVILLDAMMPGLDGFETCRRIKANGDVAHVPVIFMTGLTETEHVVKGLSAGGVDYVTKPIVLDELVARIHVHLANARMTRSALTALDTAGRRVLAADKSGNIRWATPAARQLLEDAGIADDPAFRQCLTQAVSEAGTAESRPATTFEGGGLRLAIGFLGAAAPDEFLFRLSEDVEGRETVMLQHALSLTPREADVLLWIARGKSNRDASEILNISARTVNKHLEQIFIKLGVENRAAAASVATRVLFTQD